MAAAYIEPRPKAREPHAAITHCTIVSEGKEHGEFKTQEAAVDHASAAGHRPVHVARVRHSHEHDNPDHFRKHTCPGDCVRDSRFAMRSAVVATSPMPTGSRTRRARRAAER